MELLKSQIKNSETFSKGQLQEQLKQAIEKNEALQERIPEFYDPQMLEEYVSAVNRFKFNEKAIALYVAASTGNTYEELVENYNKFTDFQENQLKPIEQEIRNINGKINALRLKEREASDKQARLEEEENFKKEKEDLANRLYELLDSIHAQIPKEAVDSGMKTEIALQTYLPELKGKAQQIESFIERIEDAAIPYDLKHIKRDIDGWNLFTEKV